MPYASKAQQGFLHARLPDVAKKFDAATSKKQFARLPDHVKKKKTKRPTGQATIGAR